MKIGVFFGSRSPEHDISIITGQLIIAGLKKLNYEVVPVYLDKQGRWLIGSELGELKSFTTTKIDLDKFQEYFLDLEKSHGKLVFRKKGIMGSDIEVDLAFPAFHGANGEDGTIQGLFEIFDVPYVGCGVAASALTMNKITTKLLYRADNIPTTEFVQFTKNDWEKDRSACLKLVKDKIGLPVVIKPPLLGSSIGISKGKDEKSLEFGIEVAFHYGNEVLVEDCVEDLMDVTCAVMGNNEPIASLLQESVLGDEVLSYDDKYMKEGGTQTGKSSGNVVIPARLSDETTKTIQEMSRQVYKLLGLSGIARVDYLYDKKAEKFYANEVNTLPGTLYHHLWAKSGVELDELLKRLVRHAQEAYEQKKKFATTFESDILKMAGSVKLQTKK